MPPSSPPTTLLFDRYCPFPKLVLFYGIFTQTAQKCSFLNISDAALKSEMIFWLLQDINLKWTWDLASVAQIIQQIDSDYICIADHLSSKEL